MPGPGQAVLRIDMAPWADNATRRDLQVFKKARNGIGVAVGPCANGENRALDCRPVFADRTMLPIFVVMLVFEPERREERQTLQTFNPCIAPASTHNRRVKRTRLIGEHDRAPPQIIIEQQTAHVVDVVAETVVGRIGGDDRLQRGRTAGCNLEAVETAPALAHHADIAAAPWLFRDPGDDF